jgi:outer membrane protein OmpA-like peptidoglycan-associated protein
MNGVMRAAPLVLVLLILSACGFFGGPRYVVFFTERSAQLDSPAQRVIAHVATRAKDDPSAKVEVAGYTDNAGSPAADVLLSKQRAKAVADALEADGVAASRLVLHGRGQTGGNPGVESRRVEISIGDP